MRTLALFSSGVRVWANEIPAVTARTRTESCVEGENWRIFSQKKEEGRRKGTHMFISSKIIEKAHSVLQGILLGQLLHKVLPFQKRGKVKTCPTVFFKGEGKLPSGLRQLTS